MNAVLSLDAVELAGWQELSVDEMQTLDGGVLLYPWWLLPVGGYLLKTVGDNWGPFKEGVVQGFRAVAG